jgi:hypothetical protein
MVQQELQGLKVRLARLELKVHRELRELQVQLALKVRQEQLVHRAHRVR